MSASCSPHLDLRFPTRAPLRSLVAPAPCGMRSREGGTHLLLKQQPLACVAGLPSLGAGHTAGHHSGQARTTHHPPSTHPPPWPPQPCVPTPIDRLTSTPHPCVLLAGAINLYPMDRFFPMPEANGPPPVPACCANPAATELKSLETSPGCLDNKYLKTGRDSGYL